MSCYSDFDFGFSIGRIEIFVENITNNYIKGIIFSFAIVKIIVLKTTETVKIAKYGLPPF